MVNDVPRSVDTLVLGGGTSGAVIAGRIASHRHWARRRRTLRLRAALFGRRKQAARAVPAPAATPTRRPAAA